MWREVSSQMSQDQGRYFVRAVYGVERMSVAAAIAGATFALGFLAVSIVVFRSQKKLEKTSTVMYDSEDEETQLLP
jgi:hypothetical protein